MGTTLLRIARNASHCLVAQEMAITDKPRALFSMVVRVVDVVTVTRVSHGMTRDAFLCLAGHKTQWRQ